MRSEIKITNRADAAVIDIEGVIGVPEKMQFDNPGERVATYARFTEALRTIETLEASEIVVNIRSTGGDVNDALLIYDALAGLDATVVTRCAGYVASSATIIAQAASPGCREISANTMYLIHCSESAAEGNSRALARTKQMLDTTDSRIKAIYAARSGRPESEFEELMNENGGRGRWLTAEEAVAAGLADRVLPSGSAPGGEQAVNFAALDAMLEMLGLPAVSAAIATDEGGVKKPLAGRLLHWWRVFIERMRLAGGGTQRGGEADGKAPGKAVGEQTPGNKSALPRTMSAQDSATPTATGQKEDPSPADHTRTANEQAYENDAYGLRAR